MTEPPDPQAQTAGEPETETPMQRALRLKKAALARRSQPGPTFRHEENAKAPAGRSKPWMTR